MKPDSKSVLEALARSLDVGEILKAFPGLDREGLSTMIAEAASGTPAARGEGGKLLAYVDGAARGNPGEAGAGVVFKDTPPAAWLRRSPSTWARRPTTWPSTRPFFSPSSVPASWAWNPFRSIPTRSFWCTRSTGATAFGPRTCRSSARRRYASCVISAT